jgi:serine/threonine-protein kinase
MGTVQYLAPEQATGKPATPSTDIYSLGLVAYEALTGKRPFTGESQMVIAMAQINDKPPAMDKDIDSRVQDLVLACLAKKPSQRPGSALDLSNRARALRLQLEGLSPTEIFAQDQAPTVRSRVIEEDPKTEPSEKQTVIWPWLVLIGLLFAAAAGVMIAIVLSLMGEQTNEAPVPTFEPSVSPTEPPTEEPGPTVVVLLTDIIGKNVADASIFLKERGLQVDAVPGEPLDPADPRILTVYRADGLGQVVVGSTVKIYYYIQQTIVPGPTETLPAPTPTDGSTSVPIPVPSFTVTPIPTAPPTPTPTGTTGSGN